MIFIFSYQRLKLTPPNFLGAIDLLEVMVAINQLKHTSSLTKRISTLRNIVEIFVVKSLDSKKYMKTICKLENIIYMTITT